MMYRIFTEFMLCWVLNFVGSCRVSEEERQDSEAWFTSCGNFLEAARQSEKDNVRYKYFPQFPILSLKSTVCVYMMEVSLYTESDQQTKPSPDADKLSGRRLFSPEKSKVSKQVKYTTGHRNSSYNT